MNSRRGLTVKTSPVFVAFFSVQLWVVFITARTYPFFSLQRIFSELMMPNTPPIITWKVTSLKIKLQRDFTVRIFSFLANHSFPHKQECFQLSEPSWREVKTVRGIHLAAFLWVFLVQGSHYSLRGEVAEKHCVYMGRVVVSLNRHVSRRRQMKELVVLQTGKNNILPVVFICRAPWFMPSHL